MSVTGQSIYDGGRAERWLPRVKARNSSDQKAKLEHQLDGECHESRPRNMIDPRDPGLLRPLPRDGPRPLEFALPP